MAPLARASLAQGHWRVALRRLLMAQARGDTLPADLEAALARLLPRLAPTEHAKMRASALCWVQMTQGTPGSARG